MCIPNKIQLNRKNSKLIQKNLKLGGSISHDIFKLHKNFETDTTLQSAWTSESLRHKWYRHGSMKGSI